VTASATADPRPEPGTPGFDPELPRWLRWLLPAIVGADYVERDPGGGSDLKRSPRDWAVDLCLFGWAVLLGAGLLWGAHHYVSTVWLVIDTALAIPACVLVWFRRRQPLLIGWLVVGASLVSDGCWGAATVALFTVAVHCPPKRTLQLAALSVLATVSLAAIYAHPHFNVNSLVFCLMMVIVAVGVGGYVRVRRELLLSLRDRARRAEDEQQLRIREARTAERGRIAREMHDVLAHRISLLSVHAGALEYNPNASPEEIARAAAVIRVSARAAQEELREIVGVMRTASELDADELPVQPPQPTIADLEQLVAESRGAGMEVALNCSPPAKPAAPDGEALPGLSPTIGRTVYRLVQEALTNVRKHAPGHRVMITIDGDRERGVQVEVVNRPRVGQAQAQPKVTHVGSGTGLVGLSERVALVHGELVTEQLPGGGFRLSAKLPWNDSET
jgi:signal transduction histidine kinase